MPRGGAFSTIIEKRAEILDEYFTQHLPINLFLVDRGGYVCWVNEHLLCFLGMSLEKVQGLHISNWNHTRWEYVYEVIMNKELVAREETYEGKHFFTMRQPLFDEEGAVMGVLGVSLETTSCKSTELAKKQFFHNIRHDVRTPVSGIIGLVSVLRDVIDKPDALALLDSLAETSESLLKLLDRIFESIQISTGEISTLRHRFSLKDTLESVYKLHKAKALEKKLSLTFDYDPNLPPVVIGEVVRVQRIVWELLTNALKYTDEGSVALRAKLVKLMDEQLEVEIRVQDTGVGIPLDKHDFVFGQFTRLVSAWTGGASGQGLGLFNVKKLVADLGGKIYLDSALGKGSAFTCFITFKRAYPRVDEVDFGKEWR